MAAVRFLCPVELPEPVRGAVSRLLPPRCPPCPGPRISDSGYELEEQIATCGNLPEWRFTILHEQDAPQTAAMVCGRAGSPIAAKHLDNHRTGVALQMDYFEPTYIGLGYGVDAASPGMRVGSGQDVGGNVG
jgi:hypothetical protein